MRLAVEEEIEYISKEQCPFCHSKRVETYVMRASCDGYCQDCAASWSQYKDGKTCIWRGHEHNVG